MSMNETSSQNECIQLKTINQNSTSTSTTTTNERVNNGTEHERTSDCEHVTHVVGGGDRHVTVPKPGGATTRFTRKRNPIWKRLLIFVAVLAGASVGYLFCHWYFSSPPPDEHDPAELARRRQFIAQMTASAWNAYQRSAWPDDALDPVNSAPVTVDYAPGSGWTIVAAMSTLWVMGLREQFEHGRQWIETSLNLSAIDRPIPVEMIQSDYLASLLSCYALTNDSMFLDRAKQIARLLEPAYSVRPPALQINPATGQIFNDHYAKQPNKSFALLSISDATAEYKYLAEVTDFEPYFVRRFEAVTKLLEDYLVPYANLTFPKHRQYNAYLKWYIQSHGHAASALEAYEEGMDSELTRWLVHLEHTPLTFARSYDRQRGEYQNAMNYDDCYLGSMLAIGSKEMRMALLYHNTTDWTGRIDRFKRHKQIARQLTDTCHQAMARTATHLAPALFYFDDRDEATNTRPDDPIENKSFRLTSGLAQSYFVLWRQTHDPKYRDFAWDMAQSIEKHCRCELSGGYAWLLDAAQEDPPTHQRLMQPDLLAGTLKYLYLTFSNYSIWPMDRWVYSTAGHPIPINIENK